MQAAPAPSPCLHVGTHETHVLIITFMPRRSAPQEGVPAHQRGVIELHSQEGRVRRARPLDPACWRRSIYVRLTQPEAPHQVDGNLQDCL